MTVGIIAEFNPFHKGHAYLIEKAKKITGADCAIVVMSGDFVQRGAPAVCDKYLRCRMALEGGADIVLELPVAAATGSAELFAEGAVKLLASLGVVDTVVFGSECGDIDALSSVARKLLEEDEGYKEALKAGIKSGLSFPKARQLALGEEDGILNNPNNILAVEYCKAVERLCALPAATLPTEGYRIPKLLTIKRAGAGYHDTVTPVEEGPEQGITDKNTADRDATEGSACEGFASSTAIRKLLLCSEDSGSTQNGNAQAPDTEPGYPGEAFRQIGELVPESTAAILAKEYGSKLPIEEDDLSDMLAVRLWTSLHQERDLSGILDMTRGLENRLFDFMGRQMMFSELAGGLKTKNITYSAISRALLHTVLGTTKNMAEQIKASPVFPYARLLGFKSEHSKLLREISDTASLKLITKLARAETSSELLAHDIFASTLYNQIVYSRFGTKLPGEYETGPIIL